VALWLFISTYIIFQLTLAIVEDGFISAKFVKITDILTKNAEDPCSKTEEELEAMNSITPPDALKNLQRVKRVKDFSSAD
jgi:hypothetical protein